MSTASLSPPFNFGSGTVIDAIDGHRTPDIDSLIEIFSGLSDGQSVTITHWSFKQKHTKKMDTVRIQAPWMSEISIFTWNGKTYSWERQDRIAFQPLRQPFRLQSVQFPKLLAITPTAVKAMEKSCVRATARTWYRVDGLDLMSLEAFGLVVNAEQGLVLVSRSVIPHDLCSLDTIITGSIRVQGKCVFLHPTQSFAFLRYSPDEVDAPVASAQLATKELEKSATVYYVGLDFSGTIYYDRTTITNTYTLHVPTKN